MKKKEIRSDTKFRLPQFESKILLQEAIAGLLSRMPNRAGVQILQGAQEYGKDIIFYSALVSKKSWKYVRRAEFITPPEYIVRHIVEQVVGSLIEGKSPEEIALMRFADIACGSGSFLPGVYDELLRYHTAYYNEPRNRKRP
jgi:hypothetical protein